MRKQLSGRARKTSVGLIIGSILCVSMYASGASRSDDSSPSGPPIDPPVYDRTTDVLATSGAISLFSGKTLINATLLGVPDDSSTGVLLQIAAAYVDNGRPTYYHIYVPAADLAGATHQLAIPDPESLRDPINISVDLIGGSWKAPARGADLRVSEN